MGKNCGYIYKITNIVNGKIYIGKTKKYYGNNHIRIRGINNRFKRHIQDAINQKNYCPQLCNAIRKHGANNFTIEQLTMCKLEITSDLEKAFISFYKSTDRKIGYNIAEGGGSTSCNVSEETRKKISETQGGDLNVHKKYYKGVHVGYRAHRKQNGIYYYKTFGNTQFSVEENYAKAKEWINEIKNGIMDNKTYKKENNLPTNITHKWKQGEIKGYRVNIIINGKLHSKDFISNKYTMEEKLEQALKFKKSILPE